MSYDILKNWSWNIPPFRVGWEIEPTTPKLEAYHTSNQDKIQAQGSSDLEDGSALWGYYNEYTMSGPSCEFCFGHSGHSQVKINFYAGFSINNLLFPHITLQFNHITQPKTFLPWVRTIPVEFYKGSNIFGVPHVVPIQKYCPEGLWKLPLQDMLLWKPLETTPNNNSHKNIGFGVHFSIFI